MQKLSALASAAIIAVTMFTAQSSWGQTSVFTTDFTPSPASDSPMAGIGWTGYQGSTADSIWESGEKPSAGAWHSLSGSGYLFVMGNLGPLLLFTETSPFGASTAQYAFGQIDSVTMEMRNQIGTEDLKVAIRVGSNWYASVENFNNPSASTAVGGTLDFSTAQWRALTVNPGVGLSIGASDAVITESDLVTAVGVFTDNVDDKIRFYSYQVNAIPEPSSAALLLGVMVGLGVFSRRSL
ncbi:PEP-CTERM sorting domain-containing protein [Coraliomargarita sp. W4R53]